MPRISQANFSGQISSDVARTPTRSIESAGIVEKATQQAIQGVTNQIGDITQKLVQSEAKSQAIKNKAQYTLESDELFDQMKRDPKYEGKMDQFSKDYSKKIDDMQSRIINENSTMPISRRLSVGALAETNLSYKRKAQSYERNERVRMAYENIDNAVNSYSQALGVKYSPDAHIQRLTDITAQYKNNDDMFTPQQKEQGIDQAKLKMLDSLSTYYETNPELAAQGVDILQGRYPQSAAILDGLDSGKVNATIERLQRITKQTVE